MEQTHPAAPDPHLGLLGHFHLFSRADHVYLPPTAQRLMALLALHQDGVPRDRAAGLLWPDLTDQHAAASLRSTLWRLSRRGGQHLVETRSGAPLLFLHGAVRVDLHGAADQAHRLATQPPAEPPRTVPTGLREDLLPSWPDEWLVLAREHFHQTRLHALESLSRHLVRAGENTAAMECAMTALRAEPLRESAHRAVTETHLAEGNVAEALRHYDLYRDRLRTELGLAPSGNYRALLAPFLARPLDT
ncbi:BTAD domain-containing putative transcriptional regulator [Streptomyces sp. NPDC005892]|uniref:AfsR/SARP family transcriptional regulator n=1 Tax=Streptomyces sp. NPDC005892 TaxID=3155593 RepID=UPI003401DC07